MTPQEVVTAYEAWCVANKSYKLKWKEGGQWKFFDSHFAATIGNKITEILPIADSDMSVSIDKVNSAPSYEGFKEWAANQ